VIDWPLARRIAVAVAGRGAHPLSTAELPRLAAESERLVEAYTGLSPLAPLPMPEAVTRAQWAVLNLEGFEPLLDPVTDRLGEGLGPVGGALRAAGGALIAAEVGAVTGYIAQRVLGQYELALLDPSAPPRLLFIAENLGEAARFLEADEGELLHWVALHEMTHALQFGGVPWLREHVASHVRELLASLDVRVEPAALMRLPSPEALRERWEAVRQDGLIALVAGPEQRAIIDRIQAVMAVLEGYSEHVMDAVGAGLLPSLPKLREGMERRRRTQSPLERLLARLIGFELKLRQYEVGKRFCDAVVERGGIAVLNRVWHKPEALPSLAELGDPAAWIGRTDVLALPRTIAQ
jgi:coenzyme F420 biosynthesis associated uncharacterized protein